MPPLNVEALLNVKIVLFQFSSQHLLYNLSVLQSQKNIFLYRDLILAAILQGKCGRFDILAILNFSNQVIAEDIS